MLWDKVARFIREACGAGKPAAEIGVSAASPAISSTITAKREGAIQKVLKPLLDFAYFNG
jgi:hypothetical protein